MGANAKPTQKIVMDRLATTRLTFHFSAKIDDAELASPADNPASSVTAHEIQVIHVLRHCDQPNGEVKVSRLGGSGGGDCPGPGGRATRGVGRGVWNSRYRYSGEPAAGIILFSLCLLRGKKTENHSFLDFFEFFFFFRRQSQILLI